MLSVRSRFVAVPGAGPSGPFAVSSVVAGSARAGVAPHPNERTRHVQKVNDESIDLTFYPAPTAERRGAVIVCPGGGYQGLAAHEGEPVARRFGLTSPRS